MPDCLRAFTFDGDNAQQTESTLELKNQIVAGCKWLAMVAEAILRNRKVTAKVQGCVVAMSDNFGI